MSIRRVQCNATSGESVDRAQDFIGPRLVGRQRQQPGKKRCDMLIRSTHLVAGVMPEERTGKHRQNQQDAEETHEDLQVQMAARETSPPRALHEASASSCRCANT